MHFREGNRLVEPSLRLSTKSKLLRIDAHKPKLFGLNSKNVKGDKMKYPEKFIMSELIKMTSAELSELESALWEDWSRVNSLLERRKAHEVVSKIKEEE